MADGYFLPYTISTMLTLKTYKLSTKPLIRRNRSYSSQVLLRNTYLENEFMNTFTIFRIYFNISGLCHGQKPSTFRLKHVLHDFFFWYCFYRKKNCQDIWSRNVFFLTPKTRPSTSVKVVTL